MERSSGFEVKIAAAGSPAQAFRKRSVLGQSKSQAGEQAHDEYHDASLEGRHFPGRQGLQLAGSWGRLFFVLSGRDKRYLFLFPSAQQSCFQANVAAIVVIRGHGWGLLGGDVVL